MRGKGTRRTESPSRVRPAESGGHSVDAADALHGNGRTARRASDMSDSAMSVTAMGMAQQGTGAAQ